MVTNGNPKSKLAGDADLGIDGIDPAYYTIADGDGQTTATREAGVDVVGGQRPPAECRASVLHATESDPRRQ